MIINFNNIKIKTHPLVYIPGEDTFFLEDTIKEFIYSTEEKINFKSIAEMGSGSGYITIQLMKLFPESYLYAIDKNQNALEITQENILLNGLDSSHIELIHSDLFTYVAPHKFDLIVFNPPYLPTETSNLEKIEEMVKITWEGGNKIIQEFLTTTLDYLKENGVIILLLSNYQIRNNKPEEYISNITSSLQVLSTFKKKILLETLFIVILTNKSL
jgi:release factor glutamine methyltransferase